MDARQKAHIQCEPDHNMRQINRPRVKLIYCTGFQAGSDIFGRVSKSQQGGEAQKATGQEAHTSHKWLEAQAAMAPRDMHSENGSKGV